MPWFSGAVVSGGRADRESVGEGKRGDLGGGRIIKKKKKKEMGRTVGDSRRCGEDLTAPTHTGAVQGPRNCLCSVDQPIASERWPGSACTGTHCTAD